MPEIPLNFGQSSAKFELIGTDVYGFVVCGHDFGVGVPSATDAANAVMDSYEGGGIQQVTTTAWRLAQVDMSIMTATGLETASSTRTPLAGLIGNLPGLRTLPLSYGSPPRELVVKAGAECMFRVGRRTSWTVLETGTLRCLPTTRPSLQIFSPH